MKGVSKINIGLYVQFEQLSKYELVEDVYNIEVKNLIETLKWDAGRLFINFLYMWIVYVSVINIMLPWFFATRISADYVVNSL